MIPFRLIIGISGSSGAIYGVRLLEVLHGLSGEALAQVGLPEIETHLVVTPAAEVIIEHETPYTVSEVKKLASVVHDVNDLGASISSGSFLTAGMVVAPCSVRTLGAIATAQATNLLLRAADVTLKERRRLVLLVRETPLHLGHLRAMVAVTELGAIVMPPLPAFYPQPKSLDDLVNQTVGRVLDLFALPHNLVRRWEGLPRVVRQVKS